jgi:hypothetical protein
MAQKFPNILKVVIFFLLPVISYPQTGNEMVELGTKKYNLNKRGMTVLTTWSALNIAGGAGYFISGSKEEQYFYAMNAGWGVINLAIALPGLTAKKPVFASKYELLANQTKTEKIFLANAMLDLVYITGGFVFKEAAKNQSDLDRRAMYSGFGNSFILQGAGLFFFDVSMTQLNNRFRKKHIHPLMLNTQVSFNGRGIGINHYF